MRMSTLEERTHRLRGHVARINFPTVNLAHKRQKRASFISCEHALKFSHFEFFRAKEQGKSDGIDSTVKEILAPICIILKSHRLQTFGNERSGFARNKRAG